MPKYNPFSKFMFQLKKQNADLKMNELQKLAGDKWKVKEMLDLTLYMKIVKILIIIIFSFKNMTDEERDKYKDKSETFFICGPQRKRLNCIGQSIDEEANKLRFRREQEFKKVLLIEETLQKATEKDPESLFDLEFYFFCSSYFVRKLGDDEIFPAEIALAKFTLRQGIIDTMHMVGFIRESKNQDLGYTIGIDFRVHLARQSRYFANGNGWKCCGSLKENP